jgi:hypothetical protein
MFLGLLDLDPLVRGMDPRIRILLSSLKNDVNVPFKKVISRKTFKNKLAFCWRLSGQ